MRILENNPSFPQKRDSTTRGYAFALAGTVSWSMAAILISHLNTRYQLPPLVLAFWRDLFSALALAVGLRLLAPHWLALPDARRNLPFFVLYGLVLAFFNGIWITSVMINGAAVATVLGYSSPAFTALLGWRLLDEPLSPARLVAIGLSIAGCALVSGAYDPAVWQLNPLGVVVGLLSGVIFAIYNLMGKWSFRRGVNGWTATLYTFAFGTLFLLLPQRPATIFWLGTSLPAWSTVLALALVPTIGGFGFYNLSLAHLPVSVANLVCTLEPALTGLFAFVLLGERMNAVQWGGALLILMGIVLLRAEEWSGRWQQRRMSISGVERRSVDG